MSAEEAKEIRADAGGADVSRPLKDAAFSALARIGKALGHAHRVELLHLLAQAPRDVDALARGTERPLASTSQHLQVLLRAQLVTRHQEGTHRVYALAPGVAELVDNLEAVGLSQDPQLRMVWADWRASHPDIELASEGALAAEHTVLVDVRPEAEFRYQHRPGALSIPLAQLSARLDELPRDREIVAVCRGRWCSWADEAVEVLQAAGFTARRLDG